MSTAQNSFEEILAAGRGAEGEPVVTGHPGVADFLPDPTPRLEAAFRATASRMAGLGIVNPELRVEAVDFAPWEGHWLGVLVTPWCMNLMVLPRDRAQWLPLRSGDKRHYTFPAGDYEFIGARDATAGEFHMCSLFSPMLQFADHDTARITAKVARKALLDARTADYDEDAAAGAARQPPLEPAPAISRRALLRGGDGR